MPKGGGTMDEILEALRSVTADTVGDVAGYADQIAQVFGDTVAGSTAQLDEVNAALAAKDAEIQRLQAENYKLMTANATSMGGEGDTEPDTDEEPDGSEIDPKDYIKED